MKSAATILREAAEVIEERGKLRDTEEGERSMARAVAAYNALCGDSMEGELQGWIFMCCLKLARATAGSTHIDDWTDLAGYAALAAECVSKESSQFRIEHAPEDRWIIWDGTEGLQPVGSYDKVRVRFRDGAEFEEDACVWDWHWHSGNSPFEIVAYKVAR